MIEDIFKDLTTTNIVVGVFGLWVLWNIVTRIDEERRILSYGKHAPTIRVYLPYSIDMICRAIYNSTHDNNFEGWRELFRKNGRGRFTVEARPASQRVILTAEPENIKAILATQFSDFGKGKPFHNDWKAFLGDSIFTTDGDAWHASRQLIRPQFIKDRVSDLHTFEKHVQTLMTAIANGGVVGMPGVATDGVAQGRVVDVSDLFFRYTLDSSTDFLLGHSVDSLRTPIQEFAEAFGEVQRVQNSSTGSSPLNWLVPRHSFNAGLKVMNTFIDQYIDRTLAFTDTELESKSKSGSGYNFLHALGGFTRDRKMLRDQLTAVLLAGRDTTASTLSWTFYELARHPAAFKKLRQEIIDAIGETDAPTYDDLKSMKYLQHTMNEVLRLYPVVPFNVRMSLKDTTLPVGGGPDGKSPIGVLKDTPIGYSTLVMQRRKDLYPINDEPNMGVEYFNPDRWFGWQPKPWTYIPFNGGPRLCIGQQFALTNMGYTIVRMLQRFERVDSFMPEGPMGVPVMKADIVLQPGAGVATAFYDAKREMV
ncbi:hypothetical protein V500_06893 [Pseudogymnoascus sp. VKM F-4518 (FW-2643)]|nr:hypothetical protein V500_06893 [Pseudogymnoascus sp. VKM F-4518 (FW-2643)]